MTSGIFRWISVEADGAARKPLRAPLDHEPVIPRCTGWLAAVIGLNTVGKILSDEWTFRSKLNAEITGLFLDEPVTEASIARSITHDHGIMKGCPAGAARIAFLNSQRSQFAIYHNDQAARSPAARFSPPSGKRPSPRSPRPAPSTSSASTPCFAAIL